MSSQSRLPEARILAYVFLLALLLSLDSLTAFSLIALPVSVLLLRLPGRILRAGWIPIVMLLGYTFFGNLLGGQGRVVFSLGGMALTDEGVHAAAVKSLRFYLMIAGVKILMAPAPPADLVAGLQRLCAPLERLGVRPHNFFHILGLTIRCFPVLQKRMAHQYRAAVSVREAPGVWARAQAIASIMLPLFAESMTSPEVFFDEVDEPDRAV